MLTSRERVELTLSHREPDRVPLDLGGCGQTGMHVSTIYKLRQTLGLDAPGTPVKVVEPYQMLGEIKPDLIDALGVDVVGLGGIYTLFGFKNDQWKPWTFHDGTPLLVPENFNTEPDENGDILMYAEGDKNYAPSGKMPAGGWYFDGLVRQGEIDDDRLNWEDNTEEFKPITNEELDHLKRESERLYNETDKAIMYVLGGAGFGDIALVPGMMLKNPKGIRDIAEWYMSTVIRREYVYSVFERQSQVVLSNLPRIYDAIGDRITAVWISGTDFGTQNGPFISEKTYCELYQPFHKRVNEWIAKHTKWRRFIHCCGSILPLIPHFIESGFEILNPVQTSATNMAPDMLKSKFGDRLTFWGGGVDTQRTLPFGTPDEVRAEVRDRIRVFAPGGGFVFNPIHNVQSQVPIENLVAMYETVREYGHYPLN